MKNKLFIFLPLFFVVISNQLKAQCFKSVSCGSDFSAVVKENGTLWTWGFNGAGQLGDSLSFETLNPIQVGSDTDWQKVSCGGQFTIALKSNGTLWGFGWNVYGETGTGSGINYVKTPKQIGTSNNWTEIDCGSHHALAKKSDGTLWGWGAGYYGEIGNGMNGQSNFSPVLVNTETDWDLFAVGSDFSLGIRNQGGLYTWGRNNYGQLGDGATTNKNTPTYITTNSWFSLSSGSSHTAGLILVGAQEASLWAWGYNSSGQLGNLSTYNLLIPTQIGAETDWAMVTCTNNTTYAIKNNGSLWAWGNNNDGELGIGSNNDWNFPKQVGNELTWKSVYGGNGSHVLATKTDGSLWAWGLNQSGQLGDGTKNNSNIPKLIMACNPSGIENNQSNQFSVYPNPVNDIIYIQNLSDVKIDLIYITDINGKRIGNSYSNLEKINVQNLASGIYLLNIQNQNQISHLKFIKE